MSKVLKILLIILESICFLMLIGFAIAVCFFNYTLPSTIAILVCFDAALYFLTELLDNIFELK